MGTEVYESPSDENLVSFYHKYLIFPLNSIFFSLSGEQSNHVMLATRT